MKIAFRLLLLVAGLVAAGMAQLAKAIGSMPPDVI
jgi:hypothetical protein